MKQSTLSKIIINNMERDHKGRFVRSGLYKFIRNSTIGFSLIALIVVTAIIYNRLNPITVINNVEVIKDISKEQFASKIDQLEKNIVEQVRKCESGGHKESDGLIVFDSNSVASIGTLQFQVKTVIYYYKSLYNKVITGKEAVTIALDDKLSGQLAQDIMFKSNNLANDWLNCSTSLKLSDQIKAIKSIK